jgi:colanic acid/amylovoran biosynthesis glycosyltransferase
MNIAIVLPEFPKLSETFILNQITGLLDRGCDVRILSKHRARQRLRHDAVDRYDLPARTAVVGIPTSGLALFLKGAFCFLVLLCTEFTALRSALRWGRYGKKSYLLRDMVYLHFFKRRYREYPEIFLIHYGSMARELIFLKERSIIEAQFAVHFHGFDLSRFVRKKGKGVYESVFRHAECILPVSGKWKELCLSSGCPEGKLSVHHMGVDTGYFTMRDPSQENTGLVLTVGRLIEKKGMDSALRAISLVKRSGVTFRYVIIGDGPLKIRLEEMVHQLHLDDEVEILEPVTSEEIRSFLQTSSIFLLPSVTAKNGDQEGIPVVLMEAMSTGIPVISTFHSGIPELVEDGAQGYLVPERDVEQLASRIIELLQDREKRMSLGRKGREKVTSLFNIDGLNDRLIDIFEGMTEGRTSVS